jgi:hypothetical protein
LKLGLGSDFSEFPPVDSSSIFAVSESKKIKTSKKSKSKKKQKIDIFRKIVRVRIHALA